MELCIADILKISNFIVDAYLSVADMQPVWLLGRVNIIYYFMWYRNIKVVVLVSNVVSISSYASLCEVLQELVKQLFLVVHIVFLSHI